MRTIDADALMQTLGITDMDCEKCEWGDHNHCIRGCDFEDACSAIEDAPTIEPERKKGQWINHRNDNGHNIADCDKCGEAMQWFDDDIKPNFCPICGADMRGAKRD